MKSSTALTALAATLTAVTATPLPLAKRASNSWGGTNLYFLQGLPDDAQETYLQGLQDAGAKVVRVWVNGQPSAGSCQKGSKISNSADDLETIIGQYNDDTLALLDKSISKIAAHGMKALVSPHDANLLNGANGNDIYGQTYGSGDFYTSSTAAQQYDARLSHILNYVSPSSGTAWKDWSSAIMGIDIQNEPMAVDSYSSSGDPSGWLCSRAKSLRSGLGSSAIKIGTGGIGGDYSHNGNLADFATGCAEIDMISVHRYATSGWATSDWISQANGKLVYVEEWGVDGSSGDQGGQYAQNVEEMNGQGLPYLYWQILPKKECETEDSDQFGIYMGSGVDWASQMRAAGGVQAAQDWSGIVDGGSVDSGNGTVRFLRRCNERYSRL